MCSVTSPFYWLPRFTSPGGTPAWPDDRGDHLQYARSHSATSPLRFSRCPSHSWLHDCTKPHWFDSHHAGRQLADRACDFTGDAAFQRHRGLVIGAL